MEFAAFHPLVLGEDLVWFGFLFVIFAVGWSLFINGRKRFTNSKNLQFLIFRQLQKVLERLPY